MWTAFSEIDEAIKMLRLTSQEFTELNFSDAEEVVGKIRKKYLGGKHPLFWWECYLDSKSINLETPGYKLLERLSPDSEVYFVPHGECENRVYLSNPKMISKILGECAGFEYSLIGKSLDWIITENHHDVIVVVGERAKNKLRGLNP